MESASINAIKTTLDNIHQNFESFKAYHKTQGADMDVYSYGSENEYNLKGVIAGVKNILADLGFLTRSHNLFVKLSTFNERREINQQLQNLNSYLAGRQVPNIISVLDVLKTKLRTYNLRTDRDRYIEYNNALDDLCRKAIELEDSINDVKKKIEEAGVTYTEIQGKQTEYTEIIKELTGKKDEFKAEYDAFVSEVGDFKALADKAKANEQTVATHLKQVEGDKETFDEFIEKIDDREKVLTKQNEATENYEKKLDAYDKDQQKKLKEVAELIEKARQALQYTTAAGMSAAFQEQYDKTNNRWSKIGWLVAAAVFLILTIAIGAWIVTGWGIAEERSTQIYSLIGRLSMVPFTILAAIFCANQYVKQKNLAEDYAYKAVLTKSIVAFSDELRENDEKGYSEYISTVLKEIHQDPLRKRGKEKDEITIKETTGILGKALDIIQSFTQKA
jgi:uncharacterized coiled-coil DUF342 family protein